MDEKEIQEEVDEEEDIWTCNVCGFEGIGENSVWRHIMDQMVVIPSG